MSVLVIAAHPDDEVLGVGGTIAASVNHANPVDILIVTEGCSSQYPDQPELIEVKKKEAKAAANILGARSVHFGGLPDMKLDTIPITEVNRCIEKAVKELKPNIVFCQARSDVNLDHRIVFDATLVACRPYSAPHVNKLLSYYAPSSSEWGPDCFDPNWFVDITQTIDEKVEAMRQYRTEVRPSPHPRHPDSLRIAAGYFGSISGYSFAEPFRLIRARGGI